MKAKQEENKRSREEDNKRIKAAEHSVAELKKEVSKTEISKIKFKKNNFKNAFRWQVWHGS